MFLLIFSGASLEQTHIFCLSHILRRPIIVYGIKYVKSFRGETLGYARFQGMSYIFFYFLTLKVDISFVCDKRHGKSGTSFFYITWP